MYIRVMEWNKVENWEREVAVWGDTPEYPENIREIVREIAQNGYAERGDSVYTDANTD